ncbi:MAG: 3-dehydroquinate synthase family protein, partial [Halanaerobiales bacterium]
KTAINHTAGKNLIGAFYQPVFVLIDPVFLKTLPDRELKTGLAEAIKHGFIADRDLIDFFKENRQQLFDYDIEALTHIIYTSCIIKSSVVNQDEKEKGKRALLNFGHTIGHALEAVTGYKKYNHGEAVAIGMVGAAYISWKKRLIDRNSYDLLLELIKDYGLPVSYQYNENTEEIYERLFYDKKVKNSSLRWILLRELGDAFVDGDVDISIVEEALEGLK